MERLNLEAINKTIKALEKNNMVAYYVENSCKAKELVTSLIPENSIVSFGGSVTLNESGIMEILRSGKYKLLDRSAEGADVLKIYRDTFGADFYLTSSNAITQNGELYNVDGYGNRVTALTFGPKQVIVVAGINKIVKDLYDAILRVKTIAAPKNCVRLSKKTYCAECGKCVSLNRENPEMTDGCDSPDRICRQYVINAKQPKNDRFIVILVGESLGY